MTPQVLLIELLDRIAALPGEKVLVRKDELSQWPTEATEALKSHNLIRKTRPAASVVCDECEKECLRPVHTLRAPSGDFRVFIVCDKLDDVDRVPVPIERLEQWQTSGTLVADLLSGLLGLVSPAAQGSYNGRWEIGLLKGKKHSSHLVLMAGDTLSLTLAGHSVPLTDVLTLENNQITVDKRTLTRLVDNPVAGAGDVESSEQRRERIKKRVNELKAKGVKAFLKTVAEEEGIGTSRIKQLIQDDNPASKSKDPHW
ncbi:MAG: hypothetical protein KZQ91_12635 [Candidatus Thiodiazotropha sp. (ex Lucinoma borealis)]|nr:hypothetical protein [Candidatus Thiodiazotropha sp. (ex Lucinoma borealis)]